MSKLISTNPAVLIENTINTEVNPKTYFERNTEVVNSSDAVVGFQVNENEGVADTLNKASEMGKPVASLKYTIE